MTTAAFFKSTLLKLRAARKIHIYLRFYDEIASQLKSAVTTLPVYTLLMVKNSLTSKRKKKEKKRKQIVEVVQCILKGSGNHKQLLRHVRWTRINCRGAGLI